MNIRSAYLSRVKRDGLLRDDAQMRIVDVLQDLQIRLTHQPTAIEKLRSLLGFRTSHRESKGLYLWGGVGRGKTFLMDLFFETLEIKAKRRIHFHRIMREIHSRLASCSDTENPLERVAADIAREARVLCFDEFFVSDIGDAMVLGRLLDGLFANGVTLIATSNSPPDRLYPDGLQRERFLPAIALLENHTAVIELDSDIDYRLRLLQRAATYLTPADDDATDRLRTFFHDIAPGDIVHEHVLDVMGRDINTVLCAKSIVWFDFAEICDGPRSQNDYIEIARWYQAVIISDVPTFDSSRENEARRFISLVDEFYDRRVKLILSAGAPIAELYRGRKLAFEFRRTASRLTEMQSAKYQHAAHIA